MKNSEIFEKHFNINDPQYGVRNLRQIKNVKDNHTRNSPDVQPGNLADDILRVLKDLRENSKGFVKRIVWIPGQDYPIAVTWEQWQVCILMFLL